MSASIESTELERRLVVEPAVCRLCIALNRFAEASEIIEIRLAELQAPPGFPMRPPNDDSQHRPVITITALSSADTVKRLSNEPPQIPISKFGRDAPAKSRKRGAAASAITYRSRHGRPYGFGI